MRRSLVCTFLVAAAAAITPAQDAANLLDNPGFEAGAREPEAWTIAQPPRGVSIRRDTRITLNSRGSLRLDKDAENYFPPAGATQTFERDPGRHAIELAADVRPVRATKVVLDVQFEGGGQRAHEWAAYIGARNEGDPPVTHDWQRYSGQVTIPSWAKTITIAVQIWGPGTAWVDNVSASYVEGAPPPDDAGPAAAEDESEPADAPPGEDITVAGDANKRYFLHGPKGDVPGAGYHLLVVLPGGDGSAEFQPFVSRVAANAMPGGYVVAQAVAPVWTDSGDRVVWPTQHLPDENMAFPTEQLVLDIIDDVKSRHQIDPRHVYIMGWSSGGPASYAATLRPGSPIRGALVAMSVFKPDILPPVKGAAGKAFYILHSPQDFIPMRFPEDARDRLARAGADTTLETYEGGHGWRGDPFALIREGVEWLEERSGG